MVALKTSHLVLVSFKANDAAEVARLAGDRRVVEMTASIPYPYPESLAVDWIRSHEQQRENGNYIFAIRSNENDKLMGCVNLAINKKHDSGHIGYWMGYEFWNQGYCSEAVKEILRFGFEDKKLNKVWAPHLTVNVASGRVMEKNGMIHEGIQRQHFKRDGKYFDLSIKSILASDYFAIAP